MRRSFAAVLAGACAFVFAATAAADVERSNWSQEGGEHIFKDDPLAALGNQSNVARIRVRPKVVRTYLLRARTSFVPEMFKSVEQM